MTPSPQAPDRVTLVLEGRIVADWVALLAEQVAAAESAGFRVDLDLGNVRYLDRDGVALVRRLRDRGAQLLRCSGLLRQLIREQG